MRGSLCASRRFYSAFFRWHVLNSPRAGCRGARSISYHLVSGGPKDQARRSTSADEDHSKTAPRQDRPLWRAHDLRRKSDSPPAPLSQLSTKLLNAPVEPSSVKPFDKLAPWEQAVRYKSEAGMLLQIAIPAWALRMLQAEEGKKLEGIQEMFGARVEIGEASSGSKWENWSVTLSGTFQEVQRARSKLLLKKTPTWLDHAPVSESKRPSSSLPPWGKIVRQSAGFHRKVEVSIPSRHWAVLCQMGIEDIAARHGIELAFGSKFFAKDGSSTSPTERTTVLIEGQVEKVWACVDAMSKRQGQASARSEQSGTPAAEESAVGKAARVDHGVNTVGDVERCRLSVRLPPELGVTARDVAIRVVTRTLRVHFAAIQRQFSCNVRVLLSNADKPDDLLLKGSDETQVRKALAFIQEKVNESCKQADVPPVELQVSGTGTYKADSHTFHRRVETPSSSAGQDVDGTSKETADDFRLALRTLSHPVVLVTSKLPSIVTHKSPDDALSFCRGVTVSSFNSITLSPKPMVSLNIRTPSRTWDAISSSGKLNAHFLTATPQGAALAHAFTLPYARPDEPFWRLQQMGARIGMLRERPPHVNLSGAVSAIVRTEVDHEKCVKVGDHMIVVAEVKKVLVTSEADGKPADLATQKSGSLTYAKRGFRAIGEQIEPARIPNASVQGTPQPEPATEAKPQESTTEEAGPFIQIEDDDEPVGGVIAETNGQNSSQSSEKTVSDYFAAMAEEVDDASLEPSRRSRNEVDAEEEEHHSRFDVVGEEGSPGPGQEANPLVENPDAALEEEGLKGGDGGEMDGDLENGTEQARRGKEQRKSAVEENST